MSGKQNQGSGKVIRLRRANGQKPNIQNRLKKYKPNNANGNGNNKSPNKQQIIARNLSTLKENIKKKQLAQEMYYQNNTSNRSPLVRQNQQRINANNNAKGNVHRRLGNKNTQNKNKKNVSNANASNPNKNVAMRQNKAQKIVNIKRKINKVRNKQQQQQQQVKGGNNYVHNITAKKIILRRPRPQASNNVNPMNYTVQVRNDAPVKHHTELNPRLQAEIKMIQKNSHVHEIVQAMPLHPPGSGFTKTTLNERFSQF